MRVELEVFSGRPNPAWELSEQEASELARLHALLGHSPSDRPLPEGLGYRGFRVAPFQAHEQLIVWRDIVQVAQSGRASQWSDPDRSLERWLLDTARAHVEPGLLGTIRSLVDAQ